MSKVSFIAGVMSGMVIGTAVGMVVDPMKGRQAKAIKKGAGRAFKTLGSVIDSIIDMK